MNEVPRRIEKAIASYACALMNDTKWREVLELVAQHDTPVQFSFVREEKFKATIKFPEGGVENDHTKDCTIHGPFFLKEIYAIRFPKFEEKRNPQSGSKFKDQTRYKNLIKALSKLGQLPITECEEWVTISGYKK